MIWLLQSKYTLFVLFSAKVEPVKKTQEPEKQSNFFLNNVLMN